MRNKRGILLIEVMIAVLILAVGITGSIQALRHILDVSRVSHEFFEAKLIADDVLFDLFSFPAKSARNTITNQAYQHEMMKFADPFRVSSTSEDLLLSGSSVDEFLEEAGAIAAGSDVSVVYKKFTTTISCKSAPVIDCVTIHRLSEPD